MKKLIAMFLLLALVLCGCGAEPAETTAPTTTEAPTEPPVVYTNPLTGETLDEELTGRTFAVTINNVPQAMPMYGVSKADLYFEMYVNDYTTRGLALFADIREVKSVGSVRSLRYNFTDICQTYDAIVAHASGSDEVMSDVRASGVPNINVGTGDGYHYRDQGRLSQGYAWEHCLFVKGPELRDYAESKGIRVTREADADYGLLLTEDGTPDGEAATKVTIKMIHDGVVKQSVMQYDETVGAYQFYQYGKAVYDGSEEQYIYFENVIVMLCKVQNKGAYHVADLAGSGEGYFACGGKIIPILWSHESMDAPILFTLQDGTPLELGVGNSYIAICPLPSTVLFE